MRTKTVKVDPKNVEESVIREAASVLERGGLVAFPTETVYGIAANLLDRRALERLKEVKDRPEEKQFSIHVADPNEIDKYAVSVLPRVYKLINRFWPGPLTLVLSAPGAKTVGLRMPKNPIALRLLSRVDFPVVAPSANFAGHPAPRDGAAVARELDGHIDMILDGGPTELGVESTVLDARTLPFTVLREGYLKKEDLLKVAGRKTVLFVCTGNSCRSVMAEYLLKKRLLELKRDDIDVASAGTLAFAGMAPTAETLKLVETLGLDASGHRAQRATDELVKEADLIFAMERRHQEDLVRRVPSAAPRIKLLAALLEGGPYDDEILDPIGKSEDFYGSVFFKMESAIDKLGESL